MHDPHTLLFQIRIPWTAKPIESAGKTIPGYNLIFLTVWHKDPCTDGSDDSCGIFMRTRHGSKEILQKIKDSYSYNFTSTTEPYGALFYKETSVPVRSYQSTTLWLFFYAAYEFFDKDYNKTKRFLKRNLLDILLYAENPVDGLFDCFNQSYGPVPIEERIDALANCIYAWILRAERPWYRNPFWHLHHWRLQFDLFQTWRSNLLDRCEACGKPFKGTTPHSTLWDIPKAGFLKSRRFLYHQECLPKEGNKNA